MNLQGLCSQGALQRAVSVGLALAGVLIIQPSTPAAEQVMLRYNVFERSVSVDDLSEFAETGETTRQLRSYLKTSGQDPEQVRKLLSDEIEVRQLFLDEVLNSPPGEAILDEMGDFVQTPSGEANRQALRSALVLSASDDDHISLIEVLQNYPTEEVQVNGNRVVSAYRQVQDIQEKISDVLDVIGLP